jgi:DNA replication protein DnaC
VPIEILGIFIISYLRKKVLKSGYEKAATIITSNREFGEWQEIFANPLIGSAALDRLIHRATKLVIEGKSYRMEQFNKRSKKQNKETEK